MKIADLILKKLKENLSEEEEKTFLEWLSKSEENHQLFSQLERLHNKGVQLPYFDDIDTLEAWRRVEKKYENQTGGSGNRYRFSRMLKYAALFAGILVLSSVFWLYKFPSQDKVFIDPEAITLQLENGEVRVISPNDTDEVTDSKGKLLGKRSAYGIDYTETTVKNRLNFNTLNVPNGKRFKITLSDGSIAHLNAGSSLKYPVKFVQGKDRIVYLNGEGYFEVTRDDKHPFVVTTSNMNVRVLGTEFNVMAYPEDEEIKTVLVEGAVSLYETEIPYEKSNATPLLPGQKGNWKTSNKKVKIEEVDTDIYTGWRDGRLVLKKMYFSDIVRRLQRHYNIKIVNNYTDLDTRIFTATFDIETINEVLDTFAEETYFEYQINDDVITIYEPDR